MVAKPLDLPGSDAYVQPWAQENPPPPPDPGMPPAAPAVPHVPYGEKYEPAVERLRPMVEAEFARQGVPTVDSRGNDLIDKTLHVATYESHGDTGAVGDGGRAYGAFQSHYIPQGTPVEGQVADAVRLIAKNPDQFTDWGEGVSYMGKPFGALGRVPYGTPPPGGYGGDIGSAISGVGSFVGGAASDALERRNRALIPTGNAPLIDQLPGRQAGGFRGTEMQPDPNATFDDPFSAAAHAIGKGVTNAYDTSANFMRSHGPAALLGDPTDTNEDPVTSAAAAWGKGEQLTHDQRLQAAQDWAAKHGGGQLGPDGQIRPGGFGSDVARAIVPNNWLDAATLAEPFKDVAADAARGGTRAVIEKTRGAFPEAAPVGSAEYFAGLGGGGNDLKRQIEEQATRDAAKSPIEPAAPSPRTEGAAPPVESGAPASAPPTAQGAPATTEAPLSPWEQAMQASLAMGKDRAVTEGAQAARDVTANMVTDQAARSAQYAEVTKLSNNVARLTGEASADVRSRAVSNLSKGLKSVLENDSLLENSYHAGVGLPGKSNLQNAVEGVAGEARPSEPLSLARQVVNNALSLPGDLISMKASLSPPALRQGKIRLVTNPKAFMEELGQSFKAAASEEAAQATQQTLRDGYWTRDTGYQWVKKDGQWSLEESAAGKASREAAATDRYNKGLGVAPQGSPAVPNAGFTWQDAGGTMLDFGEGAPAEARVEDRALVRDSWLGRKIRASAPIAISDRQAAVEINLHRMNWYNDVASGMWQAGNRDPQEYINLRKFIEHVTHRGPTPNFLKGVPVFFSVPAQTGRAMALWDIAREITYGVATGRIARPGVQQEAAKALIGMTVANTVQMGALSALVGGAITWRNGTPTWSMGAYHLDPWAGWGPQARLIFGIGKDINDEYKTKLDEGGWGNVPQDMAQKIGGRLFDFGQKGLSPAASTTVSTLTGKDALHQPFNLQQAFTSGQLAKDWTVPFVAESIADAYREGGPVAAGAVSVPSFLSEGIDTYQTQGDYRNALTSKLEPDANGRYPTETGAKPKSYADLTDLGVRKQIDQQIKDEGHSYAPDKAQKAGDAARAEIDQKQSDFEAAFKAGQLTSSVTDREKVIHAERLGRGDVLKAFYDQEKISPTSDFAKRFAGLMGDQDKGTGWLGLNAANTDEFGQLDFGQLKKDQQDYLAKLPEGDRKLFQSYIDYQESQKSDFEKRRDKMFNDKEAKGYYAEVPGEPPKDRRTRLAALGKKLDAENPTLDTEGWYFGGGTKDTSLTPSLNSPEAVSMALDMVKKEGLQNRPVKYVGLPRPINQDENSQKAWDYSRKPIQWYNTTLISDNWEAEAKRLATQTKDPEYSKPLDKMDANHRGTIVGNIHQKARHDVPELDAMLYWWGAEDKPSTQAAANMLPDIMKRFGNKPPQ